MKEYYKNLEIEDLEGEEWKDIEGFEGMYQVSNLGRVKSLERLGANKHLINEKIIIQSFSKKNCNGYLHANLHKNGKQFTFITHRLVATAFILNANNLPCINHKNEIKTDNTVENLEWCTEQYNSNYGTAIKRRKINLSVPITQVEPKTNIGRKWDSATAAMNEGNYNKNAINNCCKGRSKTHKGFKFDYFTPPAIYKG